MMESIDEWVGDGLALRMIRLVEYPGHAFTIKEILQWFESEFSL